MYNEGTPLAEAFSFQWGPKKRPQCDSQHFSHCGNCSKAIENNTWARADMKFLFECVTR